MKFDQKRIGPQIGQIAVMGLKCVLKAGECIIEITEAGVNDRKMEIRDVSLALHSL